MAGLECKVVELVVCGGLDFARLILLTIAQGVQVVGELDSGGSNWQRQLGKNCVGGGKGGLDSRCRRARRHLETVVAC